MTWFFDLLIAFLAELRAASLINQVMSITGFVGLLSAIFIFPVRRMRRRAESTLNKINELQGRAETAEAANKRLTSERDTALACLPEAFVTAHATEMRDHNEERAMALAESYVTDQHEALSLAFRTRMDEAIRQSPQDGAPAFETALLWARAAQALNPQDRQLLMLIDDLKSAASVAASGARVKLKDDGSRAERLARNERLPMDVGALATAFYSARDRGEYTLMLFLADHGLTITRRPPFGEGSMEHLFFLRHRAEALMFLERNDDALSLLSSILDAFSRMAGEDDPQTMYLQELMVECQKNLGDSQGALTQASALLRRRTKVQGSQHPDVLSGRHLLAQCMVDNGDAKGALEEINAFLPKSIEVQGGTHHSVLSSRYLLAQCLRETGDLKGALNELESLAVTQSKVIGERHPHTVLTRNFKALCHHLDNDFKASEAEFEAIIPIAEDVLGANSTEVLLCRYYLAQCRLNLGNAELALSEIDSLLPRLIETEGSLHTNVLGARLLRALCLEALGQREEAGRELNGLQEGFDAASLPPTHSNRTSLQALRDRLSAPPSPQAPPDV